MAQQPTKAAATEPIPPAEPGRFRAFIEAKDKATVAGEPPTMPAPVKPFMGPRPLPPKPVPLEDVSLDSKDATKGLAVTATPGRFAAFKANQPPEPKTVGGFVKNVAGSTADAVIGVGKMLTSPVQTITGMGTMAAGALVKAQSAIGRPEGEQLLGMDNGNNPIDAVFQHLDERYGSWESIKNTMYNDPAGFALDLSSVLDAGAGLVSTAGRLAKVSEMVRAGEYAGKVAKLFDPVRLVARPAAAVTGMMLKPLRVSAGRITSEVFGKWTGAGRESVVVSAHPDAAFTATLRGDVSIEQVADNVREAAQQLRTVRGNQYRGAFRKLPPMQLDFRSVLQSLQDRLDEFGVKMRTVTKQAPGTPSKLLGANGLPLYTTPGKITTTHVSNFDLSTLGDSAAQSEVRKIVTDVKDWQKRAGRGGSHMISTLAMDTLKRRLDTYYHQSSNARAFTASIRAEIRNTLSAVPGYDAMTADYERATSFLREIEGEFMVGTTKQQKGATIRRLATALNQNNDYRKTLLEAIDAATNKSLKSQVAGVAMSSWVPRGLASVTGGTAALAWHIAHSLSSDSVVTEMIGAFGMALSSSPRIVAETAGLYSAVKKGIKALPNSKYGGAMLRGVTRPGVYRQGMDWPRSEGAPTPPPGVTYVFDPARGEMVPQQ